MRAKRAEFLLDSLDKLEDKLCGDSVALRVLYDNCLRKMADQETVTVSEVRDCDTETPEGRRSPHNKTYIERMQRLSRGFEENKNYLKTGLAEFGLTKFPIIRYSKGGGHGNESSFTLDIGDSVDTNNHEYQAKPEESLNENDSTVNLVSYKTEKISRPPWYLKVANPLFKKQKTRAASALSGLALVFLILPLIIGYMWAYEPEVPFLLPLFLILLVSELMLMGPALNVFHLATRKISMVETFKHPISTVCISELSGGSAKNLVKAERKLSVVTVSADCPVCKAQYDLEGTVLLEQRGIRRSRIIGVCANNPMMHQFSFDKDLMAGERLNVFS